MLCACAPGACLCCTRMLGWLSCFGSRLAPVSAQQRMNTLNSLVKPDTAIVELILMHSEGRVSTSVRIKATHDNSVWSEPSKAAGS